MKTANRVAFNAELFENDKPSIEIKKIVNKVCTKMSDFHGNTCFMISPSCLLYDRDGFHYSTENEFGEVCKFGDMTFKMGHSDQELPNLERYEISSKVPRVFVGGKYRAFKQALLQAKYKYPNRIMIIKNITAVCILFYDAFDNNYILFDNNIDKIIAIIEGGIDNDL